MTQKKIVSRIKKKNIKKSLKLFHEIWKKNSKFLTTIALDWNWNEFFFFSPHPPFLPHRSFHCMKTKTNCINGTKESFHFFFWILKSLLFFFQHPRLFWIKKSFFLSYFFCFTFMREKIFQQKSTRIFGFVCCRKIFCHYSPDREKKMKNRSIDQISTSSMCILCFASQYLTVDRKIFQKKKRKNFSKTFFFILSTQNKTTLFYYRHSSNKTHTQNFFELDDDDGSILVK